MPTPSNTLPSVAIIGAGISGAACAAGLHGAGFRVELFDKSRGVGGRMATRRVEWTGDDGGPRHAALDHGAQHIGASHPRFRAVMRNAEQAGRVAAWWPRVHTARPGAKAGQVFVPVPGMPALCRHLLGDLTVHLNRPVQRLQRNAAGWQLAFAGGGTSATFDHAVIALPAPQAALLLAGHHDDWADELSVAPMVPCWTLMAVTDDVDWPWDAAEPTRGPFTWVARNDRKPGRDPGPGVATWTAHASAAWSAEHLEDEPAPVLDELSSALNSLLPRPATWRWHHRGVHRWRYAAPAQASATGGDCRWDHRLRLGVCGDLFAGGSVESAWRSGDELADTMAAWAETRHGEPGPSTPARHRHDTHRAQQASATSAVHEPAG